MKTKNILLFSLLMVAITSCEKHDPIEDWARIGNVTPTIYWELPSTTVSAGNNVTFYAQFYSSENVPIDRMEVWYDEIENISMEATCPNVSFAFTKSSIAVNKAHVFQKKATYEFKEAYWSDSKRAYVVNDIFPTSNTLKMVEWKEIAVFDQAKFDKLYPDTFATAFKRDLYAELEKKEKYSDLRMLMVNLDVLSSEELKNYTDSAFNDNSQSMEYWIKNESKTLVKSKYDAIPFSKLIFDISNQFYKLNYKKDYAINAAYKVFDKNGNVGVSEKIIITLN